MKLQNITIAKPKILAGILALIVSFSAGFAGGWFGSRSYQMSAGTPNTNQATQNVLSESGVISSIAKQVGESVVSVNVVSQGVQQDIFGFGHAVTQASAGTGFIISSNGLVITNRHVVPSDNAQISLTLSDGTELKDIQIIGRTSASDPLDIAFLKIKDTKGKQLKPVTLGESSNMQVGDRVIAIGNALGQFQNTVTTGIISGYGRSVQASGDAGTDNLQDLFQTDAAINEGNSGGPLVNINGQVIGINTAIAGGAQNIGFSIPIDDVKGLIDSVLTTGKLQRPYLGVRYIELTDDVASELNLNVKRGAYISASDNGPAIVLNSPAEKAGLKEKDVITKLNGESIDEKHSLITLISHHKVGEQVTLTIIRDGKEQTVNVTLEASPQQ
jgi:serine protease Do